MMNLHRAMMALTLTAVVAFAAGALPAFNHAALAQHGQPQHSEAVDAQAHFDKVAKRLELTSVQREALAGTFHEAMAAMQELHRLHGVIAAQLDDGQKEKLADLMHEAMGGLGNHEDRAEHRHGGNLH